MHETSIGGAAFCKDLFVTLLDLLLLFGCDRPVVQWRTPIGSALEDGQMSRRLGNFLDELHGGCTRADHANPFTLEADRFMRPGGSVIGLALEVVDTVDRGHHRLGEDADCRDQEASGAVLSILRLQCPQVRDIVEMGRGDLAVEIHVAAQTELVGDEVAIAQVFRLG